MHRILLIAAITILSITASAQKKILVFQTDFGVRDGAVSAMKGVALSTSSDLKLFDLTHEIPAYNIWEAGYRLQQTAQFWPSGTVFVSVIDPGVGTDRRSIVMVTKTGHIFVGPDNGQFTLIAESMGIRSVYQINEAINRRKESGNSYTFHGRDVYAYTGARLAAGIIPISGVGPRLTDSIVRIRYQQPVQKDSTIMGNIPVLDIQYGNVWTNIPDRLLKQLTIMTGDTIHISIYENERLAFEGTMPYVNTFGEVKEGQPLAYLNSLLQLSFALNMADFAAQHKIAAGAQWSVQVKKVD